MCKQTGVFSRGRSLKFRTCKWKWKRNMGVILVMWLLQRLMATWNIYNKANLLKTIKLHKPSLSNSLVWKFHLIKYFNKTVQVHSLLLFDNFAFHRNSCSGIILSNSYVSYAFSTLPNTLKVLNGRHST